jgi:hypothetical protein
MKRIKTTKPATKPAAWQIDPTNITTSMVQHWSNGIMSKVSRAEAVTMVQQGSAFVINEQAVGALVNGNKAS